MDRWKFYLAERNENKLFSLELRDCFINVKESRQGEAKIDFTESISCDVMGGKCIGLVQKGLSQFATTCRPRQWMK